eukprot:1318112-Pleurochrysis_carterae.AAC.2
MPRVQRGARVDVIALAYVWRRVCGGESLPSIAFNSMHDQIMYESMGATEKKHRSTEAQQPV